MSEDSRERRRQEREERRKKREEAMAAEEAELERKRAQRRAEREARRKALAEEEEKQEAERQRKREERRKRRESARQAEADSTPSKAASEPVPLKTPRMEVARYERATADREAERRAVERREKAEARKAAEEKAEREQRAAEQKKRQEEEERKHAEALEEEKRLRAEEERLEREREERHKKEQEEEARAKKEAEAAAAADDSAAQKLDDMRHKLADTEDALADANIRLKREERRTAVLTDDARAAAQEAAELSDENARLLEQIKQLKLAAMDDTAAVEEVASLKRKLESLQASGSDSSASSKQLDELKEEVESLKKSKKRVETKLADAEKETDELKDEVRLLKRQSRKAGDASDELDTLKSKNEKSEKEIDKLKKQVETLESENKDLKATSSKSSSSSHSDDTSSGRVAELEEKIKSLEQQLALQATSSAPRLTSATSSRPSRRRPSNRRAGGGAKIETVEREEPAKTKYKPPGGGNPAMSMMANLAMQAKAKQGQKKLSSSSHSVHTSLGTKGGEISRTLYILKGKQRCRAVRVEDSVKSITDSDVFILETKTHLWTFCGKKSNRLKIARAVDVVGKMQRQRGQARAAKSIVIERETSQNQYDRERDEWWDQFPEGKPASIPEGQPDQQWEKEYEDSVHLFRFTPDFDVELVQTGRLTRELLETSECYIVNTPTEMYCWTGRGTDTSFRKECVVKAQEMLQAAIEAGEKPSWVEVERVSERGEGAIFEDKFFKWPDSMRKVIGKVQHKKLSNVAVSNKKQELPRIKTMHDGELLEQKEIVPDVEECLDHDPEIFIVKDFRRTELPKDEYGKFYASNCYVISYKYEDTAAIYFWLGRDAGFTEMGTAASLAKEYNGELGGKCNILRVDQGRENRHFLAMFGGKLSVIIGARGDQPAKRRLFQIRGTDKFDTRSFECSDINGVYLCSDDVFVLVDGSDKYTWVGGHASSFIKDEVAPHIEKLCGSGSSTKVREGSESISFWKSIGGKSEYAKHEERSKKLPVKLFLCNNSNKVYNAHRTRLFVQNDLLHSHQAMVDRYTEVLLWIGVETKPTDKMLLIEIARDFVEKARDGRPKDCKVYVMDEGEEHVSFTRYFQAWNPQKSKTAKKNVELGPPRIDRKVLVDSDELMETDGGGNKYTLKELSDKDYLPAGVDKTKLEDFLRDEDFQEAFGCSAKEFWALPGWKRLRKKKASILF